MHLKRPAALMAAAAMLFTFGACQPKEEVPPVIPIETTEHKATTAPPETTTKAAATKPPAAAKQPTDFDEYQSNTTIATGSNYIYPDAQNTTFRTYFPVEEYGELTYAFYFSNTVDSTWERGRYSYAGLEGGSYTIVSAKVADGGTSGRAKPTNYQDVTFDGSKTREVEPGETFWSDEITIDIPEDHYLVWEWTLTGNDIPCIRMTEMTYSYIIAKDAADDDALQYNMDVPGPQLIGAKRDVKKRIVCLGDSITQGAETTSYKERFWAAKLSQALGDEYAVWNLGLGYARASDAALCGDWLERAKSGDVVTLAFGTNDLAVGQFGAQEISSAEEIEGWLRKIIEELRASGCKVILFNAPPFGFDAMTEIQREALNERIPIIAEETGCEYFDWNKLLADPDNPAASLYGGHPDDDGCEAIADALTDQFGKLLK